jgi:predicted TIM-barrel fold metal-dependent hydrolase
MTADPGRLQRGTAGNLIDVHSHVYTRSYAAYLRARSHAPRVLRRDEEERFVLFDGDLGVEFGPDFTNVDAKMAFMDAHGVDRSVLSLGNPWLDVCVGDDSVDQVALADRVNDELAELARHPSGRLACMGVLPAVDVPSAVHALERLSSSGLCGAVMSASFLGRNLDDPALDSLWEVAARDALPLFIHPQSGLDEDRLRGYGQSLTLSLSFPFETTVALARMVLSGVFQRHPGLRVIAAHGGGALPYLIGRVERARAVDDQVRDVAVKAGWPDGLLIDSILHSGPALRMCVELLGPERIVFGSDHPFPIADPEDGAAAVTEADLDGDIAFRTAESLFGKGFGGVPG